MSSEYNNDSNTSATNHTAQNSVDTTILENVSVALLSASVYVIIAITRNGADSTTDYLSDLMPSFLTMFGWCMLGTCLCFFSCPWPETVHILIDYGMASIYHRQWWN